MVQAFAARLLALVCLPCAAAAEEFSNPEPVTIEEYEGHAMEPFLTRDDRILMFNNRNIPEVNTDLHWAERVSATRFRYRGKIAGANSESLDAVASMDGDGMFYFVSPRNYQQSLRSIYRGEFSGGRVSAVRAVQGLSRNELGELNFDAEISADGQTMYAVDGTFRGGGVPKRADIFIAKKQGDGFVRSLDSENILARVNTSALEYAPATTADELELFFTRLSGALFWRKLQVMRATRSDRDEPYGEPRVVAAIEGFVEAPTLSSDGRSLYYHKKIDGLHRIFRVTR